MWWFRTHLKLPIAGELWFGRATRQLVDCGHCGPDPRRFLNMTMKFKNVLDFPTILEVDRIHLGIMSSRYFSSFKYISP